jgi:hypothetical protein
MAENDDFKTQLKDALNARGAWLERNEMPKLKDDFRTFHSAVNSIYTLFVKKGYIVDDPYRNDAKTDDLKVPDVGPINESNKRDHLGECLSSLGKELDYIVNFCQFSLEFFSQQRIKVVMGIISYIDWTRLGTEEKPLTEMMNGIIVEARRGLDAVSRNMLNDSLASIGNATASIASRMKLLSEYNREDYKYNLRVNITDGMSEKDAQVANIRKQFAKKCAGESFYPELVEELRREDYTPRGPKLREAVLKKLAVTSTAGKKAKKAQTDFKPNIIDALNSIGTAGGTLNEIAKKIDTNYVLMSNKPVGLFGFMKKLWYAITGHEDDSVVYELEFTNPKGGVIHEDLHYNQFFIELGKKTKILQAVALNGTAAGRLPMLDETQLVDLYLRNAKDLITLQRILGALDIFFKKNVAPNDRGRVRGIKPELSALKSISIRANDRYTEYKSLKEEAEQFKRLGIDADVTENKVE